MAADPIAEAFVRIRPDASGFRGDAERDVKHAFGGMAGAASGAFRGIALGAAAAGAAVGGFGALALNAAGNFEQSLNVFQAVTKSTGKEMKDISALAKTLGADITLPATSAKDAADAMTELAKGGLTVTDTMKAAKGVLQLSAAATIDNARAAQITARALNAFGLAGTKAGMVADVLANAANASTGEIEDFALGLQQSSAIAKSYGLSINETTAALMELANAGVVGSDAGTSLKTMLMSLTPTTKKQVAAFRELGVDTFNAKGEFVGIRSVIDQFHTSLKGLTEEQQKQKLETIFGSDATRAANIIMGQGAKVFDEYIAKTERSGSAAELAASKMKGFKGSLEGLKSAFQTLMISIGEPLLNVAAGAVRALSGVVNTLDKIASAPTIRLKLDMAKNAASDLLFGTTKKVKTVDASARIIWRTVETKGLLDKLREAVSGVDWRNVFVQTGKIGAALAQRLAEAMGLVPWANVWAGATGIAAGLATTLEGLNWTTVGSTIGRGLRDSIVNAAQGLKDLGDAFTDVLRGIGWEQLGAEIGPGLATALATAFVTLMDPAFWIRNWELALAVGISAIPGARLAAMAGKLVGMLGGLLVRGATDAIGLMVSALTALSPRLAAAIGSGIQGLGRALLTGFSTAFEAVVTFVARFSPRLAHAIVSGLFALPGLAARALAALRGAVAGKLDELQEFVTGKFKKLGALTQFVVKVAGIAAVVSAIRGFVEGAIGFLGDLRTKFAEVMDWMVEKGLRTLRQIVEPFSKLKFGGEWARDLEDSINDKLDKINADKAVKALQDKIEREWRVGTVRNAAAAAAGGKQIGAAFAGSLTPALSALAPAANKAGVGVVEAMRVGLGPFERTVGARVRQGLAAVAPGLTAAGREVGRALGAGVVGGAGGFRAQLAAALTSEARAAVVESRRQLAIRSPSGYTHEQLGVPLGEGVTTGFRQGAAPLAATMSDVFTRAVDASKRTLAAQLAGIPDVFMRAVQAAGRTVQSSTAILRGQLERALGGAFRTASKVAIDELIGGLKKLPGALRTSVLDAIGGQTAAAWTGAMHGLNQAGQAIVAAATKYGVDARAALAVAMGEGGVKFGAVGDKGTSFGPFQMHLGGALPAGMDPKKAAAFANSIRGIEAAVRAMAAAGAKGKVGMAAIQAIVRGFEKPADPSGSIAKAAAAYKKLAGGLQAIPGVAREAGTALERLTAFAKEQGVKITSTTGGKHAPGSKHYQALAVDIAGSAGKMREFFMNAMKKFGPDIDELFFDPIGFYLDNGQRKQGAIGDHGDHVHLALKAAGAGVISGATAIQDGADFAKDAIGGAAEIIKRALAQLANISEFQTSIKQAAREAAVSAGLIPAAVVSQGAFNAAIGNAEKLMRRLATTLVGEQEMERIKAGLDRAKQTISARLAVLSDTINNARTKFTEVWQTFRDNVTRAFSETVVGRFRLNVEFGDLTLTLERAKIDAQQGWDAFAAAVGNAGPAEAALVASFNRTAQAQQAYFTALASGNRAIIEASAREYAAAQSELARNSEGAAGDVAQAIIRGGQAALAAEDTLGRDRVAKAQRRWEDLATAEQENVGNYIDRVQQRLLAGKVTFGAAMAQITEFLRARGLDLSQVGEVMGTAFQTQLNQSLRALPLAFAGMETAIGRLERAITFLLRGLPGGATLLRQLGRAHREAARDADAHAASTDKVGGAIVRGSAVVGAARIPFGAAGKTVGEAAAGGIISGFGEKLAAGAATVAAAAAVLGVNAGDGLAGGVAGGLAGMQAAIAAGLGEGIVHIDSHGIAYDEAGGRLGQKITAGFAKATAQLPAAVDAAATQALATPVVDAVAPVVAEQETYAARSGLLSTFVTGSTEALAAFYEKTLIDLRTYLRESLSVWRVGQEEILTMFLGYVDQYRAAGRALGEAFAVGMLKSTDSVARAAEYIASIAAKYFPHSPAKAGPLRDLGRMGEEVSAQLAAGMIRNVGAIAAASAAAAQAAAPQFTRIAPAAVPAVPNSAGAAAASASASAIPLRAIQQTEQQALEQLRIGNELLARLLAKEQDVVVNVGVANPNEIARSVRR